MSELNVNSSTAGDKDPIDHDEYDTIVHEEYKPIYPDVRNLVGKSLQEFPGIPQRQVLWLPRYTCS